MLLTYKPFDNIGDGTITVLRGEELESLILEFTERRTRSMVYVLDKNNNPLMPTENHAKVRVLLKTKKAEAVRRYPFTIRLLYDSTEYTQDISLGVDAGSKHIGLSATTETKVLFEADIQLRNDIVDNLSTRREYRRSRRSRKTRYRKPRFDNRKREDGWLAPSVREKVETHLTAIRKAHEQDV